MSKIVCNCGRRMSVNVVGLAWLEKTELSQPYAIWSCDELVCTRCWNTSLILANMPFIMEWEPSFYITLNMLRDKQLLRGFTEEY